MDVFLEGETLYVFFTLEGSGVAIGDLKLDGCEVVYERSVAEKYGFTLFEGEELNGTGTVMFAVEQKGYERELTYRKAVFRVGVLTPQK